MIISGPVQHYSDDYGNKIDNCPINCKITLLGYCNTILFDNNICSPSLSIKVRNDSRIIIGSDTRLSGRITCFSDNWDLIVGSNCKLTGVNIDFHRQSFMEIGSNTTMYGDVSISVGYQESLKLGKDCMIAESVMLLCGDCHAIFDINTGNRINGHNATNSKKDILIGDHVWLGKKSSVLAGSKVGDGAIIGANAVVKGTYPNNVIVVGNPSKIIRKNIAWSRNYMSEEISSCEYYSKTEEDDQEKNNG